MAMGWPVKKRWKWSTFKQFSCGEEEERAVADRVERIQKRIFLFKRERFDYILVHVPTRWWWGWGEQARSRFGILVPLNSQLPRASGTTLWEEPC